MSKTVPVFFFFQFFKNFIVIQLQLYAFSPPVFKTNMKATFKGPCLMLFLSNNIAVKGIVFIRQWPVNLCWFLTIRVSI